jgi:hypothetical protein
MLVCWLWECACVKTVTVQLLLLLYNDRGGTRELEHYVHFAHVIFTGSPYSMVLKPYVLFTFVAKQPQYALV